MRKITQSTQKAFNSNTPMRSGNTAVVVTSEETSIILHGNKIAWKTKDGLFFCLCGWNTLTTRERLQAADISISQCKFEAVTLQEVYNASIETLAKGSIISSNGVYQVKKGVTL